MTRGAVCFLVAAVMAGGCPKKKDVPATASTGADAKPAPPAAVADAAPAAPITPPTLAFTGHAAVAVAVMEAECKGDFAGAVSHFHASLAKKIDAAALGQAFKQLSGDAGAFQAILGAETLQQPGDVEIVFVRAQLAHGTMEQLLVFTAKTGDAVVSLNTGKADVDLPPYAPPAYVDGAKFDAREVMVGAGVTALPGTLTVPKGAGPFPAVVLVHGSGGGDRDETSDAHARPFRDLAEGLASRGVIVLRYDKRTHGMNSIKLGTNLARFTVKEEYLDDVATAAAFLGTIAGVDPKRVFVLGHSEGGWLTPWFLELHPELAGGIVFAGCSRWFADVLPDQYRYMSKINDGQIDAMEQLAIADIVKKVARAHDPQLPLDTNAKELPLDSPASYWLSLQPYDATVTAAKLTRPLLVLQGERDYQVTAAEDYALWQKTLAGRDAEFHLYPKLNHYFFAGEGPITPQEYGTKSGPVDPQVVEDIAAWITKH